MYVTGGFKRRGLGATAPLTHKENNKIDKNSKLKKN